MAHLVYLLDAHAVAALVVQCVRGAWRLRAPRAGARGVFKRAARVGAPRRALRGRHGGGRRQGAEGASGKSHPARRKPLRPHRARVARGAPRDATPRAPSHCDVHGACRAHGRTRQASGLATLCHARALAAWRIPQGFGLEPMTMAIGECVDLPPTERRHSATNGSEGSLCRGVASEVLYVMGRVFLQELLPARARSFDPCLERLHTDRSVAYRSSAALGTRAARQQRRRGGSGGAVTNRSGGGKKTHLRLPPVGRGRGGDDRGAPRGGGREQHSPAPRRASAARAQGQLARAAQQVCSPGWPKMST